MFNNRVVVWFSCGAASAVAAKLALQKYPDAVIVYCDTLVNEHTDNARFLSDVEKWIGKSIVKIRSQRYDSVDHVIQIQRYIAGPRGAKCTGELKRKPRLRFQQPGDLHIFGLTSDEKRRIERFDKQNTDIETEWILLENNITHDMCLSILRDAGIKTPEMYNLGFKNNNCIGCVKSNGVAYWQLVRKHFPDVFEKRCKQSRELKAKMLLVTGDVPGTQKRVYLDELPLEPTSQPDNSDSIECGVLCTDKSDIEKWFGGNNV